MSHFNKYLEIIQEMKVIYGLKDDVKKVKNVINVNSDSYYEYDFLSPHLQETIKEIADKNDIEDYDQKEYHIFENKDFTFCKIKLSETNKIGIICIGENCYTVEYEEEVDDFLNKVGSLKSLHKMKMILKENWEEINYNRM